MDEEKKATTEEKMEVGTNSNQQRKEEEYELQWKIYVGQLSDEESDTGSDYSGYSYFG